jgi:hypothetical protein
MSRLPSQQATTSGPGSAGSVTVLNPACSSTRVEQAPLTPRTLTSLDARTIFLVDIGWGGPQAGHDVLEVIQGWLAAHVPSAKTILVAKRGPFAEDDPELWNRIRAEGDACIIGVSC